MGNARATYLGQRHESSHCQGGQGQRAGATAIDHAHPTGSGQCHEPSQGQRPGATARGNDQGRRQGVMAKGNAGGVPLGQRQRQLPCHRFWASVANLSFYHNMDCWGKLTTRTMQAALIAQLAALHYSKHLSIHPSLRVPLYFISAASASLREHTAPCHMFVS